MEPIETRDRSDGVSITDTGIVGELEEELIETFEYCKGTARTDIGIDNIYVVGSYARGEADRRFSDIDVVISYEHIGGEALDPHFDVDKGWVSACMSNYFEDGMPWPLKKWAEDIDVLATTIINKHIKLENYFDDTRVDEIEGTPRVYDLTNREYIYERDIDEKVKERDS